MCVWSTRGASQDVQELFCACELCVHSGDTMHVDGVIACALGLRGVLECMVCDGDVGHDVR